MLRPLPTCTPELFKDRAQSLKRGAPTKEIFQVAGVFPRKAATTGKRGVEPGGEGLVAKAIILFATFWVTQDRVRFRDFFKLLFGSGITGVYIWMILPGEATICVLIFLSEAVARQARAIIIVCFAHMPSGLAITPPC